MISSDCGSQIFEKKNGDPNLGQTGQNRTRNYFFCHFLKFGSLFFLEIVYIDNLQQCLTSSRGKMHEKKFWGQYLARN